jgi:hypothetical protein
MRKLLLTSLILFSKLAFALDVQTMAEPQVFYHWFNAEKLPKLHLATNKIKPNDPKAFNYISSVHLPQWIAASDNPVNLRQQGGTDENWILIELHVNPGFKSAEVAPESCPSLNSKSSALPAKCMKTLEEIVTSNDLDGLKLTSGEIILTNGKSFHPGDVRIFNHLSSDETPDRLKIQSLFYKADFEHFKIGLSESLFPSEINRLNPPFSGGGRGLLWDDLDGKPLDLGATPTRTLSEQPH